MQIHSNINMQKEENIQQHKHGNCRRLSCKFNVTLARSRYLVWNQNPCYKVKRSSCGKHSLSKALLSSHY